MKLKYILTLMLLLIAINTASAAQENLAYNKTVTQGNGSNCYSGWCWNSWAYPFGNMALNDLQNVVDGQYNTSTNTVGFWCTIIDACYVQVDLQGLYELDQVNYAFALSNYQGGGVSRLHIEVSEDNETWETITVHENTYSGDAQYFNVSYGFNATTARYVRESVTVPSYPGQVYFTELQVFAVTPTNNNETKYWNNSGGGNTSIFGAGTSAPADYKPTTDTITVSHVVRLCRISPTNSWINKELIPAVYGCDTTSVIDLRGVVLDDLPSGGTSNRIAPSELVMIYIKLNNYQGSGTITITWKNLDTNTEFAWNTFNVGACGGNCGWSWWYWQVYYFVGHYSWEILFPGNYQVTAHTTWGDVVYKFKVVDTTPLQTLNYSIESVPAGATVKLDGNVIGTTPFVYNGLLTGQHTFVWSKTGYVDYTRTYTSISNAIPVTATLDPVAAGVWSVQTVVTSNQVNVKTCAGVDGQGYFFMFPSQTFQRKFSTYIDANTCSSFSIPLNDMRPYGNGTWYASIYKASEYNSGTSNAAKAYTFFNVAPAESNTTDVLYSIKTLDLLYQPYYINSNIVYNLNLLVDYNSQPDKNVSNYYYKIALVNTNGTEILYYYPSVPSLIGGLMILNNTGTFGASNVMWPNAGGYSVNVYEIRNTDNRIALIASKSFVISAQTGCNKDNPNAACNQPGTTPGTTGNLTQDNVGMDITALLSSKIFWALLFICGIMLAIAAREGGY